MHAQDMNIHGKVFGGYLMSEAFDLAHITAMCQAQGGEPELLRVDQVLFLKPVNMGNAL